MVVSFQLFQTHSMKTVDTCKQFNWTAFSETEGGKITFNCFILHLVPAPPDPQWRAFMTNFCANARFH